MTSVTHKSHSGPKQRSENERVVKCSWVKFKWKRSVKKCSEVEWSVVGWSAVSLNNRVSNITTGYIDHKKFAAFMAFSFIIFLHILLVPFFIIVYMVFLFCILSFNSLSYVFLLLCLCIIVMYALFCIFCFHHIKWHSLATLTEVFPCFFLSCNAIARVYLAKTGHGPHSSQLVKCVIQCIVCVDCVVLCIVWV